MRSAALRNWGLAIYGIALSGLPDASNAMDFTWAPNARVMSRLDDNIRGSSSDPIGALGFDMGGGVRLGANDEATSSELTPHFNIRRYPIGDNLDADEYGVGFNNRYLQSRYSLQLDFSYSHQSTLTSRIIDTGVENTVTFEDSINVSPGVSVFISDRLELNASINYNNVSYEDAGDTGFFGYDYLQGTSSLNFNWRENLTLFATFFGSNFTVSDVPETFQNEESETRSLGGQAGATWQWDPTLELTGGVGWLSSDAQFVQQDLVLVFDPLPRFAVVESPIEVFPSGPIASVIIRKNLENSRAKFEYSRQVTPSQFGAQGTADSIELVWENEITHRWSWQFFGYYEQRSSETQDVGALSTRRNLNRNYANVSGTLRYALSEEWMASVMYSHQRGQGSSDTRSPAVHSNAIMLVLEFRGFLRSF